MGSSTLIFQKVMPPRTKDERLYLRINGPLKRKMERWAARNNTTLSEVVTRFFNNLLEHERTKEKAVKGFFT